MTPPGWWKAAAVAALAFAGIALAALSGLLDALASDRSLDRTKVLSTLAFYYPASLAAIWIVLTWRRSWRNCLLAAASALAAAAIAEAGLRILAPHLALPRSRAISSSRLHHVYPPRREMFAGTYDGVRVVVRTNEDGLRTRHSRRSFLDHRTRIAVLGDSFVFGDKVRQEAAFPEVLEGILRRRLGREDLAVLNTGVASYSPFLERLLFDAVLKEYRPTVVLLLLDATDIGDDHKYRGEARRPDGAAPFDLPDPGDITYLGGVAEVLRENLPWMIAPVRRVFPFAELGEGLKPRYDYYDFRLEIGGRVETNRFFIYRHPPEVTRPHFDRTFEEVGRIAGSAAGLGAPFVLAVAPRFHHWNPRECPDNWERREYRLDEPHQFAYFDYFEEARARAPFPILNLLPAFKEAREFPLVLRFDPHWTERGHAFVAETLADYLIGEGILE